MRAWRGVQSVSKPHRRFTDVSPTLHPRFTHDAPTLHPRCTRFAPTLHPRCTHVTPTLTSNPPRYTHAVTPTHTDPRAVDEAAHVRIARRVRLEQSLHSHTLLRTRYTRRRLEQSLQSRKLVRVQTALLPLRTRESRPLTAFSIPEPAARPLRAQVRM